MTGLKESDQAEYRIRLHEMGVQSPHAVKAAPI